MTSVSTSHPHPASRPLSPAAERALKRIHDKRRAAEDLLEQCGIAYQERGTGALIVYAPSGKTYTIRFGPFVDDWTSGIPFEGERAKRYRYRSFEEFVCKRVLGLETIPTIV